MVAGSRRFGSPCETTAHATMTVAGATVMPQVVMDGQCPGAQGKRHPCDLLEASQPSGICEALDLSATAREGSAETRGASAECIAYMSSARADPAEPAIPYVAQSVPLPSSESCKRRTPDSVAVRR